MPPDLQESMFKMHCCNFAQAIFPWHYERLMTPYWRLYWNPVPGGCIRMNETVTELVPEYLYVIPGYLEFSTFAETPFEQFYIHFALSDRLPRPREILRLSADPITIGYIQQFIALGEAEANRQLRMLTGIAILSTTLLRLPPELLRLPPRLDPRIEEVCHRMERHPKDRLDNETLAGMVRMHRNHFIRLFHAEIGESPQFFRRRKRIELACELLHFSPYSLEEIAEITGFSDRYHFSRVFSHIIGASPAQFRRNARHHYH